MEGLTPASADDLPPLGQLLVDEPFWRHPAWGLAREGVSHLRVWTTTTDPPGRVVVVTETGVGNSVTESAGRIWAELVRRYGPPLVLLEHYPAPEHAEGVETLDLVRIGTDASPHWSRVWPTPEENPRHAGLELWMALTGTRSSVGPLAGSIRARTRVDDRRKPGQWVTGLGGVRVRAAGRRPAAGV
jgi:hypothetical protein